MITREDAEQAARQHVVEQDHYDLYGAVLVEDSWEYTGAATDPYPCEHGAVTRWIVDVTYNRSTNYAARVGVTTDGCCSVWMD